MAAKNFSRRDFIGRTTAVISGAAVTTAVSSVGISSCKRGGYRARSSEKHSTGAFAAEVERLPEEALYDYHKRLSTAPVHIPR